MTPLRKFTLLTLIVASVALLGQHFSSAQATRPAQAKPAPTPRQSTVTASAAAPNAPTAIITVNSTADGAPANNGQCTLREALINANNNNQSGSTDCTAGSGTDQIEFSALFNSPQTITLTNGEMAINQGVSITGPGAHLLTVSGNNVSRIFRVGFGVTLVAITDLTIANGKAGDVGGGIVSDGDLNLTNCVVTGCSAGSGFSGGGVYQAGGFGTFSSCTFSGNTAAFAGAVQVINASANFINCTISGNTATINPGGINFQTLSGGAAKTLAVTNCTIVNNTSPDTGGLRVESGGGVAAAATLKNSIIANNNTTNLATVGGATATITSQGFNLSNNWNGVATLGTDLTAQPLLGPLANNGGTTPTHALLPGSPALDKGGPNIPSDQRGLPRPVNITSILMASGGNESDIGAFEFQGQLLTVTKTADTNDAVCDADCSLREAIAVAAAGDGIAFAALFNTPQTITLGGAELVIGKNLTINGTGAHLLTVAGNNASRVFFISNGFTVSLSGMTITGGTGVGVSSNGNGGGIRNNGTLMVTNSTISGNTASNFGGGINNAVGTVTVTNSTISGNTANGSGATGGGIENGGNLTVTNSTISGNRVPNGDNNGGGIWTGSGTATITNSTITNNSAAGAGSAGGVFRGSGTVTIRNSIIAANVNNATQPDVSGAFDAASAFNLIGNVGTATGFTPANQNQTGNGTTPINPLLGSLANNGGTTPTHALFGGSPALDKGHSSGASTDQRGVLRPFDITTIPFATGGDHADIGAFEAQAIIVTNANDTGAGSLRAAITTANTNGAGLDDIIFDNTVFNTQRTITLTTGELAINSSLTINGPGANLLTISGNNASRVFNIGAGFTVSLNGMTITGGNAGGFFGGGLINQSTLTLNNSIVSGNIAANNGGGIYNLDTLLVNNSTISGNTTNSLGGGIFNLGTVTVTNSTVAGNTAANGGGIANFGPLTLTNATISGNSATSANNNGGGLMNQSGTATITNSTITNNTVKGAASAGGIYRAGGTVTIRNSIIAANVNNATQPDVVGAGITSGGFNLIGNPGTVTFNQTGDQYGTGAAPLNPLLIALQNNGGPTDTHALFLGSPALDQGNSSGATSDQRGSVRPIDLAGINNISDGADIGAFEAQTTPTSTLNITAVSPPAGRVSGGQTITLTGSFTNLQTVTIGGVNVSFTGNTTQITVTTPAHAAGAVDIVLTPTSGIPYIKPYAFAYLPTVFTDDTLVVGVTTAKAQHIIELRNAVDSLRLVAGLGIAPWTDATLSPLSTIIKVVHITELRSNLENVAALLGYAAGSYTDPGLASGLVIKRVHIEELRQRIRAIAG